jgi:hypothetical protein
MRLLNEVSPWLVTLLVVAVAEVYRVDLHQVAYALPEPGGCSIRGILLPMPSRFATPVCHGARRGKPSRHLI